jgi:hypothetical protein
MLSNDAFHLPTMLAFPQVNANVRAGSWSAGVNGDLLHLQQVVERVGGWGIALRNQGKESTNQPFALPNHLPSRKIVLFRPSA